MKSPQPLCPFCKETTELNVTTVYEGGQAFHYLCAMLWRRQRRVQALPRWTAA